MQEAAVHLSEVAPPRKSQFLQEFEEAAASLPVSPSASLPISPVSSLPLPKSRLDLPAPLLALEWKSLGMHAHAADDKLQQLSFTLASCIVQRTVAPRTEEPSSPSQQVLEEVSTIVLASFLPCCIAWQLRPPSRLSSVLAHSLCCMCNALKALNRSHAM